MSKTTFTATLSDGQIVTRTSETMAYTHAVLVKEGGKTTGARSWHTSKALADKAAQGYRTTEKGVTYVVVPVTGSTGKKAPAKKVAAAEEPTKATAKAPAKKAEEKPAEAPKKAATAGTRAVPTEAINEARQLYISQVGIQTYRNQYNGGWDAATAGAGVKKAASGTATVAWMDGYTDRVANPGKAGIARKWSALRSEANPVPSVEAPAQEEAPKAEAPAPRTVPVRAKSKGTAPVKRTKK